jgi:hypothetical protein
VNRTQQQPPPRPHFEFRPPPVREVNPPRPRALVVSVVLWLGAVLVAATAGVLVVLQLEVLRADLLAQSQAQFPTETAATVERVVTAALAVLLGSWAAIELLVLLFALMLAGRRRVAKAARLALVLLWLVQVVHGAVVLGVAPMPVPVLLVVTQMVGLAAIVVMFLPASNTWLARRGVRS